MTRMFLDSYLNSGDISELAGFLQYLSALKTNVRSAVLFSWTPGVVQNGPFLIRLVGQRNTITDISTVMRSVIKYTSDIVTFLYINISKVFILFCGSI